MGTDRRHANVPLEALAVHEAGHAVAGMVLRLRLLDIKLHHATFFAWSPIGGAVVTAAGPLAEARICIPHLVTTGQVACGATRDMADIEKAVTERGAEHGFDLDDVYDLAEDLVRANKARIRAVTEALLTSPLRLTGDEAVAIFNSVPLSEVAECQAGRHWNRLSTACQDWPERGWWRQDRVESAS